MVGTLLLGAVLWWFVFVAGLWGWPGIVIWGGYLMPKALRDLWRPAALPSTDLTQLRDATIRQRLARNDAATTNPALDPEVRPPSRW